MAFRQLSVFLENRPGTLLEVTETLKKANIDIRALSLAETPDYGILRLIVDDSYKAVDAIKETGRIVKINHVIGVQIDDRPGGLVEVLKALGENGYEVEYMYAFLSETAKKAEVAIRVDHDRDLAEKLLADKGFTLLN